MTERQVMTDLRKIDACIMPEPTYYIVGCKGSVDSLQLYYLSPIDLFFDESPSMVNNPGSRCNAPFKCRQHRD